MQKKFKIILIILFSLLLLAISIFISLKLCESDDVKVVKQVDSIKEYNYALEERDTKLMKKVFQSLKKELKNDNVDYEKYAEYLSELYIIDLFTLNNKLNKYDIPCLEYILDESKDNFILNVGDTLYKYIEDNSDKKRKQQLPEVSDINMSKIEAGNYILNGEKYESYTVYLSWDYKKDYGYDKLGTVSLLKKDNKLYVVNYASNDGGSDEENN